jgi:PPM family protein phosphatase
MPRLLISAIAFTHQGAVREVNEDCIAVGDLVVSAPMAAPHRLAREVEGPLVGLVADGLGGHAAGEVASRTVAERLVAQAAQAVDEAALVRLLLAANDELFELMRARPALRGMGTTVAGVVVGAGTCLVFNVGDSRVYRVDAAGLEQLSTDDTPGPKLADGRTAAFTSHLISQTLGGHFHEQIVPHVLAEPLDGARRYLVCSDGLSDLLGPDAIAARLEADAAASVRALFEAAMAVGGRDNISILLLDVAPAA